MDACSFVWTRVQRVISVSYYFARGSIHDGIVCTIPPIHEPIEHNEGALRVRACMSCLAFFKRGTVLRVVSTKALALIGTAVFRFSHTNSMTRARVWTAITEVVTASAVVFLIGRHLRQNVFRKSLEIRSDAI